jgi:hypothetical protein
LTKSISYYARRTASKYAVFFLVFGTSLFFAPQSAQATCINVSQAAAIAAAASPTPTGETPTVTTLDTCAGDDVGYAVPITTTVTFDGIQYSNVYATTNSVITFGRADGTYWDYPTTPSISIYSMDWLIIPSRHADEHLIINSSDGGFQVDLSARPYGNYNVTNPTNIIITAAINVDGTVAISYAVTGATYDTQTRTGVRLTNGTIVTLEDYGIVHVEVAPTLAPTPEPTPTVSPTPEPSVSPEPSPSPTPTLSPTPEPSPVETQTPVVVEPEPTPAPAPQPEPQPAPQPAPVVIPEPVVIADPPPAVEPPAPEPVPVEEQPAPPVEEIAPEPPVESAPEEQPPAEIPPLIEPLPEPQPPLVIDIAPEPPTVAAPDATDAEKAIVAQAIIEQAHGEPVTAQAIADAGLTYADLPPATPVEVRQDKDGNQVVITAEVAAALEVLANPAELINAIFTDPAQALLAIGSIGADMSPQERAQSEKTVVAAVIVGQIAGQAAVTAAAGAAAYRRKP